VVADRTSRRTVLVAADLVRLVSQGSLAAWLIVGRPSVLAIGLLAGVTRAGHHRSAPGGRSSRASGGSERGARHGVLGRRAGRPAALGALGGGGRPWLGARH